MSGFDDLGLRPELVAAAEAAGFDGAVPLQRAAIPVLRRGANAVLIASSGSGATAAWSLAVLDRSAGDTQPPASSAGSAIVPRVLVVTTSEERAARIARLLLTLRGGLDIPVRALATPWSGRESAGIVVAPLATAVRGVRESSLKLGSVMTLVIDHVSAVLDSAEGSAFGDIAASVPGDAQRILVSPAWNKPLERFAEAHARRAVTIPPRPADPALSIPPAKTGTISYIVAGGAEKADALARVLRRDRAETPTVVARSAARARWFADELNGRGFIVSDGRPDADAILVSALTASPALIAADVPFDAASLVAIRVDDGLVIVEPRELEHLRAIATEAGLELKPIGNRTVRGSAARFREDVRTAIRDQDLDANLALLDPLFDEFSAAEVAAGLSALLRARQPAATEADTAESRPDRPPAFVRLFVSAGTRDNIRPADLVGVITGEAAVKGEQVGKIELRDTFSVVEIDSTAADRVIRALNGTTLRGRSLRVDYDRKGGPPPARPSRVGSRPRA